MGQRYTAEVYLVRAFGLRQRVDKCDIGSTLSWGNITQPDIIWFFNLLNFFDFVLFLNIFSTTSIHF